MIFHGCLCSAAVGDFLVMARLVAASYRGPFVDVEAVVGDIADGAGEDGAETGSEGWGGDGGGLGAF